MRVLVTGASGFVGGHLVPYLLQEGDTVCAGTFPVHPKNPLLVQCETHPNFSTVEVDVRDPAGLTHTLLNVNPEVVIHLAGISFVPEAEADFSRTLLINVGGTETLLRACHQLQRDITVVVVSSAEVYGRIRPEDLPLTEDTTLRPGNSYSLTKAMAELVAQRYAALGQVKVVIARPFNHIGPGQDARFVSSSFAHQLAAIARGEAEPVLKVGNLEAKRDFSDVQDIVRGYRAAAMHGSGTFNFGSGKSTPVRTILETLIELSGVKVDVVPDPSRIRKGEIPEVYGSIAHAEKTLGWKPVIPLEESLKRIYASVWEAGKRS